MCSQGEYQDLIGKLSKEAAKLRNRCNELETLLNYPEAVNLQAGIALATNEQIVQGYRRLVAVLARQECVHLEHGVNIVRHNPYGRCPFWEVRRNGSAILDGGGFAPQYVDNALIQCATFEAALQRAEEAVTMAEGVAV